MVSIHALNAAIEKKTVGLHYLAVYSLDARGEQYFAKLAGHID
jgi:hypothetical protein